MGVNGLMAWIKKVHPHAVRSYPERWASEGVRGKRVAIDATLLTNRFHFGHKDTSQRGRTALLGWYGLIRDMKQNGVEPVAVWDERGERLWKAPEARRRLENRAMLLARRMHEDRRAARLARLQDALELHLHLSEAELFIVAESWRASVESIPTRSVVLEWPLQDTPLLRVLFVGRLAGHVHDLDQLWAEHKLDTQDELTTFAQNDFPTANAIEEEEKEIARFMEDDNKEEVVATTISAAANHLRDPHKIRVIDARLKSLPSAVYSETPRQRALSELEAEVWETLGLHPCEPAGEPALYDIPLDAEADQAEASRSLDLDELAEEAAIPEEPEDDIPIGDIDGVSTMVQDISAALAILDQAIALSPAVRDTYVRALDVPMEEHHAACRALLTAMGVPILTAHIPFEAEGLASALAIAGHVDLVGTEDSDVIVYGGTMVKNLSSPSQPLVLVDSGVLRSDLPLSEDAFRDFCILLGTDASPRIPGVGPARAYELIKEHGSVESILEEREDLAKTVVEGFMDMVENARRLFTELPPLGECPSLGGGEDRGREWLRERGIFIDSRGRREWARTQGMSQAAAVKTEALVQELEGLFLPEAELEEVAGDDVGDTTISWDEARPLPPPPQQPGLWPE